MNRLYADPLVLTGSHRDKLMRLIDGRKAPFMGTSITPFPMLDRSFTDAFADWVNSRLAQDAAFSKDAVWTAFELLNHEPETLIGRMQSSVLAPDPSTALLDAARREREHRLEEIAGQWDGLTIAQKAVVRGLALNADAAVFGKPAMEGYSTFAGKTLAVPTVQSALASLRERGFVWKSARGEFTLEDQAMADWVKRFQG